MPCKGEPSEGGGEREEGEERKCCGGEGWGVRGAELWLPPHPVTAGGRESGCACVCRWGGGEEGGRVRQPSLEEKERQKERERKMTSLGLCCRPAEGERERYRGRGWGEGG